jgi:hypothetical protein
MQRAECRFAFNAAVACSDACCCVLQVPASHRLAQVASGLQHGCVQSCIPLYAARCMLRMMMERAASLHWTARGKTL